MEDLCRTCGELPQKSSLRNIFKEVVLLELIKEFTGLQLKNKEKLPVNICNRCYNMLKEMFSFKQRCILVQSSFKNRRIKKSKSIKLRSKTIANDLPAISSEDLGNNIHRDKIVFIDLGDSDQEKNCKEQEVAIGQEDKKYNSTQDSQDSSQKVGNNDQGKNDEMETFQKSCLDEIEIFHKDVIDIALNSIPNEKNESVQDKEETKSNDRKQLEANCICEICGKIFKNNTNLKNHQYTHNTVKAFKCSQCNKEYHTSYGLTKHERIHTDNHPYVCSYCSDKFSYASAKIRHEKIHTNKRIHKCSYCEKTFIDTGSLKDHETTHTRIRKHHCDICGHWSLTRNHLRTHFKTKTHQRNVYEHNQRLQKNQLQETENSQEN